MIPISDYRKEANDLKEGEQININHVNCSAGRDTKKRLYVKRDNLGLLAYCHNCGDYGYWNKRTTIRSVADLLVMREKLAQEGERGELVLPPDCNYNMIDWPSSARGWLCQYGIDESQQRSFGIGYSPSWDRVVLPVYEDGKLVFFQGRKTGIGPGPKYVSVKAHPKVMLWVTDTESDTLVIVEDYISAVKMGMHVDSVAMLGTSPDFDGLTERVQSYKYVGLALDPDIPGQRKERELYKRLSLVHSNVKRLPTGKHQPKEMSHDLITSAIGGLRSSSGS